MKVSIIDYGVGNLNAFKNIYKSLNLECEFVSKPQEIYNSSKLILPGVGSFDWAMKKLNDSGLKNSLDDVVLKKKIPILGVCVGMQMMTRSSEEGILNGLGWVWNEFRTDRQKSYIV